MKSASEQCALRPREIEVMRLLCFQKTNKEIANALGISIKTVEKHRDWAYCKLGANCILGAVRRCIKMGIVSVPQWLDFDDKCRVRPTQYQRQALKSKT